MTEAVRGAAGVLMNIAQRNGRISSWVPLGVALLLLAAVESTVAALTSPGNAEVVGWGMTVDLVIGPPILAYLLLSWRGGHSALVVLPFFLLGFGLAHLIVPAEGTGLLNLVGPAVALIEASVAVVAVYKARRVRSAYLEAKPEAPYGSDAFRRAVGTVFGRSLPVRLAANEMLLLAFALVGWRRDGGRAGYRSFTSHVRSGSYIVGLVIASAAVVELVAVHLLVSLWSTGIAWVLSALTAYSLLWIVGFLNALRRHPHRVGRGFLYLRVGLWQRADVPLSQISRVTRWERGGDSELRMVPMGDPTLVLEFSQPVRVTNAFGRQTSGRSLALAVDEPAEFIAALEGPFRDVY